MSTVYRVVWTGTVFPRHRDFRYRPAAETYLRMAKQHDPTACIVQLDDSTEEQK